VWPTNFDGEGELLFLLCFGLGVVAAAIESVEMNGEEALGPLCGQASSGRKRARSPQPQRDVHKLCTLASRSSATAAS
jgi:hypothetical protein